MSAAAHATLGSLGARAAGLRIARVLLLAFGLALVAGLTWQVGAEDVLAHFQSLGWGLVVAALPYVLVLVLDAVAWRYTFDRIVPLSLARLTAIHVVAKAVNLVTPLGSVGGEPLKAYLAHIRGVPLAEAFASVVIWRTLGTIAQGLFVIGSILFAFVTLDLPVPLLEAALLAALAGGVLVGTFLVAQMRGLFGRLAAIGRRVGAGLAVPIEGARDLDRRLATFYRHRPGRLLAVLGVHLLSWLAEGLEVYVLLVLLGLPGSIGFAVVLAALSSAVRAAAFMIPAGLGVQEGGDAMIFMSFGLPLHAAIAFTLLRRLRQLAWAGVGFLLLSWSGVERREARILS